MGEKKKSSLHNFIFSIVTFVADLFCTLHRSVRNWVFLPSSTKGQSQNPGTDFSCPQWWRYRLLCGCFHPDWKKTWRHLMNKNQEANFSNPWKLLNFIEPLALAYNNVCYLWDMSVTLIGKWGIILFLCLFAEWSLFTKYCSLNSLKGC